MGVTVHRKTTKVPIQQFQMGHDTVRQGLREMLEFTNDPGPVGLGAVLHARELGTVVHGSIL
jgi:hypothetical protein